MLSENMEFHHMTHVYKTPVDSVWFILFGIVSLFANISSDPSSAYYFLKLGYHISSERICLLTFPQEAQLWFLQDVWPSDVALDVGSDVGLYAGRRIRCWVEFQIRSWQKVNGSKRCRWCVLRNHEYWISHLSVTQRCYIEAHLKIVDLVSCEPL